MKKLLILLFAATSFTSYGMDRDSFDEPFGSHDSKDYGDVTFEVLVEAMKAMKWQIEHNSPATGESPNQDYVAVQLAYMNELRKIKAAWDNPEIRDETEKWLRGLDAAEKEEALKLIRQIEDVNKKIGVQGKFAQEIQEGAT
jgi:hypothetical protein